MSINAYACVRACVCVSLIYKLYKCIQASSIAACGFDVHVIVVTWMGTSDMPDIKSKCIPKA